MVSLKEDTLCAQFGDNRSKIVATIVLKDMYKVSIQSLLRLSLKLSDLKNCLSLCLRPILNLNLQIRQLFALTSINYGNTSIMCIVKATI